MRFDGYLSGHKVATIDSPPQRIEANAIETGETMTHVAVVNAGSNSPRDEDAG